MTTHDKDEIIAAAKEAGIVALASNMKLLNSFYANALEHGRKAEREELSEIFEKSHTWLTNVAVIATIRARSTK